MKTYLLSVVQPDGPVPPAAELDKIMSDVDALNDEMRAAGAWVFAGGLHAPEHGHGRCARDRGDVAHDRRTVRGGQGAHRRPVDRPAP